MYPGGGGHFGIINQSILASKDYDIIWTVAFLYWVETTDVASLIIQIFCIVGHKTKVVWKKLVVVVVGGGGVSY